MFLKYVRLYCKFYYQLFHPPLLFLRSYLLWKYSELMLLVARYAYLRLLTSPFLGRGPHQIRLQPLILTYFLQEGILTYLMGRGGGEGTPIFKWHSCNNNSTKSFWKFSRIRNYMLFSMNFKDVENILPTCFVCLILELAELWWFLENIPFFLFTVLFYWIISQPFFKTSPKCHLLSDLRIGNDYLRTVHLFPPYWKHNISD